MYAQTQDQRYDAQDQVQDVLPADQAQAGPSAGSRILRGVMIVFFVILVVAIKVSIRMALR